MVRQTFDEYAMSLAQTAATRSTCLRRQIGAVIVRGKHPVQTGYNGAVSKMEHCLDVGCAKGNAPSGTALHLCRGAHAEQNAINFAARYGIAIEGATIYTTVYPCSWCAKSIVNAGIVRVVYLEDYPDPMTRLVLAGVEVLRLG